MPSNLYATIILMVTLSVVDTIRHKNTVCYYPNYLLTWQRVLCVYLNVVVALYKTIYHHRSHPYQIDITPKTTCTRHVYFYFIWAMLTKLSNLICDVWLFYYLILFSFVSHFTPFHTIYTLIEHKQRILFMTFLLYMCLSIEVSLATTLLTFTFSI